MNLEIILLFLNNLTHGLKSKEWKGKERKGKKTDIRRPTTTPLVLILNASPGFGAPLTQQEVNDFVANSKLNVHIVTIDEKEDQIIHPAWFYFDPSYNKIYVGTSKLSKKMINLRMNDRVYFCIDDPNLPTRSTRKRSSKDS